MILIICVQLYLLDIPTYFYSNVLLFYKCIFVPQCAPLLQMYICAPMCLTYLMYPTFTYVHLCPDVPHVYKCIFVTLVPHLYKYIFVPKCAQLLKCAPLLHMYICALMCHTFTNVYLYSNVPHFKNIYPCPNVPHFCKCIFVPQCALFHEYTPILTKVHLCHNYLPQSTQLPHIKSTY